MDLQYYIFFKPYQVLCQFSASEGKQTLADYCSVQKDVYPVGRLDYDSEGLLLLTNDKKLNHLLLNPSRLHEREYWVQVDGALTSDALDKLRRGVNIQIDGKIHHTLPAKVHLLPAEPELPPRNPPIRFRRHIPVSWISLLLTEGKNRQVRRMTAAVGFPTLRLVRWRMAGLTLEGLAPGEYRLLSQQEVAALLSPQRKKTY
jgi:23S rRNA pseudouridine2457 synthase